MTETPHEIVSVLAGLRYQRKNEPSLTLPVYVRRTIQELADGAARYRERAKSAKTDRLAMMYLQSAERSERNATMLIGLRARFASWRGE